MTGFLAREDPAAAVRSAAALRTGVSILAEHPLVGRVRHDEIRELVISFGKTGYVGLYRFVPHRAEVRVLGFRPQRELGFPALSGRVLSTPSLRAELVIGKVRVAGSSRKM